MLKVLTAGVGSATPFTTAQTVSVRSPAGSDEVVRGLGPAEQSFPAPHESRAHMIVASGRSLENANVIELSALI
jgi:hypothetical protein